MIDGLCLEHYIEPLLSRVADFRPHTYVDLIVRFLGYADRSGGPNACWLWTGSIHPKTGFGDIFVNNGRPRLQKAHRWAYGYFVGPVPQGQEVSHTCCSDDCPTRGDGDPHRGCVNPRHLILSGEPKCYDYVCARCGKSHTKARPIKGDVPFCSAKCRNGGRMVTKTCPACSKEFAVPWSNDDRYQTCSWACRNADTVYLNCKRCGKQFPDDTRQRWNRHYCSEACRRPPIMMRCHNCGKEFRTHESDVNRRFCSVSCVRQNMGETRLEARVRVALENLGVGFEQEYPFRRWSIDFAIPKHKIAIEADGDYWHRILAARDAKRDARMIADGWTVIRLPESDIASVPNLGQFILARVHQATRLRLPDLVGPSVRRSRRARPAIQVSGSWSRRTVAGQMPLWEPTRAC